MNKHLSHISLLHTTALALALLLAAPSTADAQRVARPAKTTVKDGVKTTRWTANGVRFRHSTAERIGWERHATAPGKATVITGKILGKTIRGRSVTRDGETQKTITVTAPDGNQRTTTTTTNRRTKTTRMTIDMPKEDRVRRITSWQARGTEMRDSRLYDRKTGELLERQRFGYNPNPARKR
jgi:hypothetical protein